MGLRMAASAAGAPLLRADFDYETTRDKRMTGGLQKPDNNAHATHT